MTDSLREDAARQIVIRYVERLKGLVRWQLDEKLRRLEGTSAIVQDALASFFKGTPNFDDPDGVWPLLAKITKRKAIDAANRHKTRSRDIGRQVPNAAFENEEGSFVDIWDIDQFRTGPSPAEASIFIEILEFLSEEQQVLLKWRLEGYSYGEMGKKLADEQNRREPFDEKTIQRRFQEIRARLESDYLAN